MESTTPASTPSPETPSTPTLNDRDKVFGATNDPTLATDQFMLGERTFPIIYLEFDDHLSFLTQMQPLLDMFVNTMKNNMSANFDLSEGLSITGLMKFCGKELPELARIICSQSDKTVTTEWIKKNARSPWVLASIVMKQIEQNRMVEDFSDFFKQILPILQTVKKTKQAME
jgi:hypothetical protein